MYKILVPDDQIEQLRGGGRYIQTLRENLDNDFIFVNKLSDVNPNDILIVASFNPFKSPDVTKRYCKKQLLIIFDVVPLKYPRHFPAGIIGNINLMKNKWSLKNFDKIITISEHSKKDISIYLNYPLDKIAVIYPKLARIFYENNNSSVTSIVDKYCIYVGDVNWNKNILNLVQAFILADVKLLLVGKPFSNDRKINSLNHPWQKEYQKVLKVVKNDKHFQLLGYQSDNELINLYKNAYLNILVSRDEGFGYSYMEAASQNCPSLLSDIDIFHETSSGSAFFTQASNPQEIADTITKIYTGLIQRNNIANQALAQFNTFSKIDINQAFKRLIKE